MALKIEWSIEAKTNLINIIHYLEKNWTPKEVQFFSRRLNVQLSILVKTPAIYKKSDKLHGAHECVLTKQNTLFYTFDEDKLYILSVWDNRQDAAKL